MIRQPEPVPDVSCQHCVNAITEAAGTIPGAAWVAVNPGANSVRVEHDGSASGAQPRAGIDEAGYDIAA